MRVSDGLLPTTDLSIPKRATYAAFGVNGLMYAALVSRVPALGADLGLSTAGLGLLLLWLSAGAVSGLPIAGFLVQRVGASRSIATGVATVAVGLLLLTLGLGSSSLVAAATALYVIGLGMGLWEVSMNVTGARIASLLGSDGLLPRLHAALSVGTVFGALLGALLASASVSLSGQCAAVACLLLPVTLLIGRTVRSVDAVESSGGARASGRNLWSSWREPRTLLLGLFVLGFAFTEGTANEWIAYVLVDGYSASESTGAAAFAVFVAAMTIGRVAGGALIARFGRIRTLRASLGVALGGVLVVALAESAVLALAGAILWGLGAALGFPVGMSAAADDPLKAAARVSVVSSIGYAAFLGGPPLLGLLGGRIGIQQAILLVCVALLLSFLTAGATRRTSPGGQPDHREGSSSQKPS